MNGSDENLKEYAYWRGDSTRTEFDLNKFTHAYLIHKQVSLDCVWSLVKLVCPEFKKYRGGVFLKEGFCAAKVDEMLAQGKDLRQVELWCNIVCLDDTLLSLPDASWEMAERIAEEISESWNRKLEHEFPGEGLRAFVEIDDSVGDVLVVFCRD